LYLCCRALFWQHTKRVKIPSVGFWACASEFVQHGWRGEFLMAWGVLDWRQSRPEFDRSGDRSKKPAMKSSTTKGATEISKGALASKILRRRCQTAKLRMGLDTPSFCFRRGKSDYAPIPELCGRYPAAENAGTTKQVWDVQKNWSVK